MQATLRPRSPERSAPTRAPQRAQWMLRHFYVLAIAGYGLLSFAPDVFHRPSRDFSIPYRTVVLVVALICIGLYHRRVKLAYGFLWFILFWVLYSVRLLFDTVWFPAVLWQPPEEYWLFAYGVTFLPALVFCVPPKEKDLAYLRRTLAIALSVTTAFAVILGVPALDTTGRLAANSALNPISTGHEAVSLVLICLYYFFTKRKSGMETSVGAGMILLGLFTVLMAGSRGPIVSLVVSAGILLIIMLRRRAAILILVLAAALYYLLPIFLTRVEQVGGSVGGRMMRLGEQQTMAKEYRYDAFQIGWQAYLEHPLTGSGIDLPSGGYVHNIVIESFMATGTIGGCFFLLNLLYGAYASWRLLRSRSSGGWLALLFFQYVIGTLFSGNIYGNPQFWYYTLAVSALNASAAGPGRARALFGRKPMGSMVLQFPSPLGMTMEVIQGRKKQELKDEPE